MFGIVPKFFYYASLCLSLWCLTAVIRWLTNQTDVIWVWGTFVSSIVCWLFFELLRRFVGLSEEPIILKSIELADTKMVYNLLGVFLGAMDMLLGGLSEGVFAGIFGALFLVLFIENIPIPHIFFLFYGYHFYKVERQEGCTKGYFLVAKKIIRNVSEVRETNEPFPYLLFSRNK